MLVYCDSVILVYYFDHTGRFNLQATQRLASLARARDQVAVSDLVRLECRVAHIRRGDQMKLAVFDAFFARSDVHLTPITTAVFDRATVIRARHGLGLADSLHLAAAVEGGCQRFLTNDERLAVFADIPVEILA